MKNYLINTLVSASNIQVSFTKEELRLYRNGTLNLLDIKFLNKFRTELSELLKNKDFYRLMVCGMAFIMTFSSSTVMASTLDVGTTIDKIGYKILSVVYKAMKWVCLIKAVIDVGREVSKGLDNVGNTVKVALKYVIAYGILLLLPQFFDWIEEACMTGNV